MGKKRDKVIAGSAGFLLGMEYEKHKDTIQQATEDLIAKLLGKSQFALAVIVSDFVEKIMAARLSSVPYMEEDDQKRSSVMSNVKSIYDNLYSDDPSRDLTLFWRLYMLKELVWGKNPLDIINEQSQWDREKIRNYVSKFMWNEIVRPYGAMGKQSEKIASGIIDKYEDIQAQIEREEKLYENALDSIHSYIESLKDSTAREKLKERLRLSKEKSMKTGKIDWVYQYLAFQLYYALKYELPVDKILTELGHQNDEDFKVSMKFVMKDRMRKMGETT